MINKKVITLLFCGISMGVIAFFIPKPAFSELSHVVGKIISNDAKSGSGAFIKIRHEDSSVFLFNIPNSTRKANNIVKNLKVGAEVEIWFSGSYTLSRNSYDAWQLSENGEIIIDYTESILTSKIYIFIFAFLFLLLVFLAVVKAFKNRKK